MDGKTVPKRAASVSSVIWPRKIPGNLTPGPDLTTQPFKAPVAKRRFPIREMKLAQDAHSRAEQQVYQSLWENARVFDDLSRVITIGLERWQDLFDYAKVTHESIFDPSSLNSP